MIFTCHIDGLVLLLVAAHFTLFGTWCGVAWSGHRVRKYLSTIYSRLASEEDLLRRQIALQEAEQRARSRGWYDHN